MFPITSIFVIVFAFLFVLLSMHVITLRQTYKVAMGDAGHEDLKRAIAAHANFIQYVPFMLIILAMCEMSDMNYRLLFMLGFLMLFSRGCHAYSMVVYEANAEDGADPLRFRKTGMVGTFAALILGSIFLLILNHTSVL